MGLKRRPPPRWMARTKRTGRITFCSLFCNLEGKGRRRKKKTKKKKEEKKSHTWGSLYFCVCVCVCALLSRRDQVLRNDKRHRAGSAEADKGETLGWKLENVCIQSLCGGGGWRVGSEGRLIPGQRFPAVPPTTFDFNSKSSHSEIRETGAIERKKDEHAGAIKYLWIRNREKTDEGIFFSSKYRFFSPFYVAAIRIEIHKKLKKGSTMQLRSTRGGTRAARTSHAKRLSRTGGLRKSTDAANADHYVHFLPRSFQGNRLRWTTLTSLHEKSLAQTKPYPMSSYYLGENQKRIFQGKE